MQVLDGSVVYFHKRCYSGKSPVDVHIQRVAIAVEGAVVVNAIIEGNAVLDGEVSIHDGVHLLAIATVHQVAELDPVIAVAQHVVGLTLQIDSV